MTPSALVPLLFALLLAVALATAALRDAFDAVVVFSAYSLVLAVLWTVFGAPDVALTEAAVGAGITTALFLAVLARVGGLERYRGRVGALRRLGDVAPSSALAAGMVLVALLATVPAFPAVGDPDAPAFRRVAPYYLEHAGPDLGVANVVTAIIAAYRGFDTFGEVVVVFAAGLATLLVARSAGWSP
ncbi:DUF4040 domain-containing protein [Halarchaeum sp. P4]|uniref:DUF4040 domain-containing protein n=1 Tax=Halarchaeum sp. P4 TaxID=3421639 RepID=UPI003EB8202A